VTSLSHRIISRIPINYSMLIWWSSECFQLSSFWYWYHHEKCRSSGKFVMTLH